MIEMISGAYGAKGRLIRPADGAFSLTPAEEERLVGRGVARYVDTSPEPEPPEPDPEEFEDRDGVGEADPDPEPAKPSKPKKNNKSKQEAPPDLSPEDVVV